MDKPFADKLAPNLFEWGADLVTLHGRSREQRYTKLANWDYIGEVAKAVSPKPLFGNGDIINYEDYNEFKAKSGAAGCMLARGIYIFFSFSQCDFTNFSKQSHWLGLK
jgi:tRNA-dihydrouridine synthase 3